MNAHPRSWLARFALRTFVLAVGLSFGVGAGMLAGRVLPGGPEIAFTIYDRTDPDIYRLDLSRNIRHNLTRRVGYDSGPLWSPDGRWIVFTSDRSGPVNVYVMDAVGRQVRLLADQTGNLFFHTVRWSADGSRLYLIHGLQNEQRIFTLPLEGGTLEEITDPASGAAVQRDFDLDPNDLSMSISPDGQHSAFVAYRQGIWGLYIGDASRRDAQFLTDAGRQFNEPPIWSRDGRHIAYVAWLEDQVDVFVLDPRSSPPVIQRLTNDHAIEAGVAWRPQGR